MTQSNQIRSSLLLSTINSLVIKLTSFISVIIFSRLLTPEDLGIFAVASSVTFMATEVRMLGTNAYLIREKELTQSTISSCIGISLLISWLLGFILFISAKSISTFYSTPQIYPLLQLMSVAFVFSPFTSIATAYFSKAFKYEYVLIVQATSKIASLILSLILVIEGYGVLSLAIGLVVSCIIEFGLCLFLKRNQFSFLPKLSGTLKILSFGVTNSLINIINRLELNISDLILGKIGSTYQVAIFSRGLGLHVFIKGILADGVSTVALPYFSQVKNNNESLANAYNKATQKFLFVTLPPIVVSGILASELILLLFGNQWQGAIPFAEGLVIWVVIKLFMNFSQMCLISAGAQKLLLCVKIVSAAVLTIAMVVIYKIDFSFFFYAFILAASIEHLLTYYLLSKKIDLNYFSFIKAQKLPVFVTCICVIQAMAIKVSLSILEITNLSILPYLTLIPTWAFSVYRLDNTLFNDLVYFLKRKKT